MRKNKPFNVLIVDDEREVCKVITKWLLLKGHKVKTASTGRKAIGLVRKESFDIVFLDIVMPGMSGVDVLEEIMQISMKTKFVMITGKLVDNNLLDELKKKGAQGCLQKPFKIEDIAETIS